MGFDTIYSSLSWYHLIMESEGQNSPSTPPLNAINTSGYHCVFQVVFRVMKWLICTVLEVNAYNDMYFKALYDRRQSHLC